MPRKFQKKVYIKDTSYRPIYKSVNKDFLFKTRVLPGTLMALGFVVLFTQVALPLLYFRTQDEKLLKPTEGSVLGMASGLREFDFEELGDSSIPKPRKNANIPDHFYITIPKLGIENARVETNSVDLNPSDNLGHYNGSALPGEKGNAFIYGHSVLPWFYNPKNYKTIFSTIDELKTGDEFYVTFNNKKLKYKVESKSLKYPDEINPVGAIKPAYLNESTMVLMTCWPAGTKAKRLMVNSTLVN